MQLERILKAPTALLIGMGVAIGSGIFRTPGLVAQNLQTTWLIVLGWLFGGGFVLMSGMVSAELATRYPRAGGEYVYLREAYGRFAAFFFGWAYTIFIIGVGAATIAAALGDFGCELLGWSEERSGYLAAAAIVVVISVNSLGLRAGAGWQNALTLVKIGALLALVAVGFARGAEPIEFWSAPARPAGGPLLAVLAAGVIPILWAYEGSTDAVKLAEEIKDVRRAMPRALIGSALALTGLYVAVNLALLRMVPVQEMAGVASVPGEALRRLFGPAGSRAMLIVAMSVCLGSLSSTVLATIRVTYALARDGLAFRFLSRMSAAQAPVPALVVVGGLAVVLVLKRTFVQVLGIYAFAAAILFGLSYASLIVFRVRDRGAFPPGVYRCPAGPMLAGILILIQSALAIGIAINSPADVMYTMIILVGVAGLYVLWKKRPNPPS
jgi:APA family basic amino acid/polyamine antiporter